MFTDAPIGVMPQRAPPARRRSEETWAAVREAYLGGQSGPEVCERFDVGLSALRQRAAREDWRRSDQVDPAPRPPPREASLEELDEDPPMSSADIAELASKRVRRALLEGSALQAQRWTRVYERWRRIAADDAAEARRLAEAAETPEETFAKRMAGREHQDRLAALHRADDAARKEARDADEDDQHDLHSASQAPAAEPVHDPHAAPSAPETAEGGDLHEVHDLHASTETKTARPLLDPSRRRAQARVEAWHARQAARAGP